MLSMLFVMHANCGEDFCEYGPLIVNKLCETANDVKHVL